MDDVIVCGGGPAGLAAATWLGRYRRKTLLLDAGEQRNLSATTSHGYLSRDRVRPLELLEAARRDLSRYDTVRVLTVPAQSASHPGDRFEVVAAGERHEAYRLLLATGVDDVFPDIAGFRELYGTAVFHCSCCDGYESEGQKVLAIGWTEHAAGFALDLLDWGAHVTLLTDGRRFEGNQASLAALERHGIEVFEEEVAELLVDAKSMTGARLRSGRTLEGSRAFFSIGHRPRNELARQLACAIDNEGYVLVDKHGETSVTGAYAAGDVTPGEQLVQAAAAEGAIAGIACALSLRGVATRTPAPRPGPDPQLELERSKPARG